MEKSGNSLFPALNSPQRQGAGSSNATGSARNKVALPKGRSLMDWIRLGNSGVDLTGVGGRPRKVTPEELKKHNTRDDCWMAIGGYVYNISQYCAFHPGGIAEIMKGAGKDGTQLFNEVHRWVNYGSMLQKCLVGPLVTDGLFKAPSYGSHLAPPRALATNLATVNRPQTNNMQGETTSIPFSNPAFIKPRYDFYEGDKSVKIVVYIRTARIDTDCLVLERPDGHVRISMSLPGDRIYRLHFVPSHPLLPSCKVEGKAGKVEVELPKADSTTRWSKLGSFLSDHDSVVSRTDSYIDCVLSGVEELTHDTRLYTISLPEGYHMPVPIGYHVKLKANILGVDIERSYTPVCPLTTQSSPYTLHFIIKIYSDGTLTQHINNLRPGDRVAVSHPQGGFSVTQLQDMKSVVLLAAGTGFTPMVRLISYCLNVNKQVHLLFFNKTQQDIMWRDQLDLVQQNGGGLKVTHVLSRPDSEWQGAAGRISIDLLREQLPASAKSETFVAACGPIPFIKLCQGLLTEMDVKESHTHMFKE